MFPAKSTQFLQRVWILWDIFWLWYLIFFSHWIQSCTKLLGHFVTKTLFPAPCKINVVKYSALRMNKKHMYTNIAWWGREGEDACLEHGYWIIRVILYTYILIMNVMMISRACVPTSFVQDCSKSFPAYYNMPIIVILFGTHLSWA